METRDRKFRAWDTEQKKYVAPGKLSMYYQVAGDESCYILTTAAKRIIPVEWTGRQDKNGKDIYEGHILKAVAEKEYEDENMTSDVIRNADGSWAIRSQHEGEAWDYHHTGLALAWGGWESFEIIGHILEDPELLQPPEEQPIDPGHQFDMEL